MAKKLIIFCDGTWNTPTKYSTNVLRMLQATEPEDANKNPQLAHYIAGIGTRNGEKVRGGTFGYGISDNIKDAYSFIVTNYEPGDEIFLFGFSRGAFTARSVAGLIRNFGVLKRQYLDLVGVAYDNYKSAAAEWHPDPAKGGFKTEAFRKTHCHDEDTKIKFLGVWDTVGALGAPFGAVLGFIVDKLFKCSFHDTKLSTYILNAYHALAIHERRWPFRPTLWQLQEVHDDRNKESLEKHSYLRYEEKWFPGVHGDVGGGHERTGLSDCTLKWIADCAARHGMNINLSRIGDSHGRSFAPNSAQSISKSQGIFYQLPTVAFVKLPSLLKINSVYPKRDYALVNNISLGGDYMRPVTASDDSNAAVLQKPKHNYPTISRMFHIMKGHPSS